MNAMMESLKQLGWFASDSLVPREICEDLLTQLQHHRQEKDLKPAAIGSGDQRQQIDSVRGDSIYWIDETAPTPLESRFVTWMNGFVDELNRELLMNIASFELHYAFYPPSAGYERHRDVFKGGSPRKISFVLYLNSDWRDGDGGELVIYNEQNEEQIDAHIAPRFGSGVVFLSDSILHQVKVTKAERFSVTGWLRNRP